MEVKNEGQGWKSRMKVKDEGQTTKDRAFRESFPNGNDSNQAITYY